MSALGFAHCSNRRFSAARDYDHRDAFDSAHPRRQCQPRPRGAARDEDAARVALDDAARFADLKQMRHDLRAALDVLPEGWLEANRDTPGDVGAAISTESE